MESVDLRGRGKHKSQSANQNAPFLNSHNYHKKSMTRNNNKTEEMKNDDKKYEEGGQVDISQEEAALYDRQIRLWGLESQNRIRKARILLVGMEGPVIEVVKNFVLAGVGHLTLMDDRNVQAGVDCKFNFFLPERQSEVNENDENEGEPVKRVDAMFKQVHEMNPRVDVKCVSADVNNLLLSPDFLKDFNVVCCARLPFQIAIEVNRLCAAVGAAFYLVHQHGMHSWVFADVGDEYQYIHEKKIIKTNSETVTVEEKQKNSWGRLEDVFTSWNPNHQMSIKQLRRNLSPLYIAMKLLKLHDGNLLDLDELKHQKVEVESEMNIPKDFLSDNLIEEIVRNLNVTWAPVSAVVGGILSQDIIRFISRKGCPIRNLFFCDANKFTGIIQYCGRNGKK